jgi:hypothetical protein
MLETCISTCSLARFCARHSLNNPSPKIRNTRQQRYTPELKKNCKGYLEIYTDDDDTDS